MDNLAIDRSADQNSGAAQGPRLVSGLPRTAGQPCVCQIVSAEQWAGAEAQIAMLVRQLAQARELRLKAIVLGSGRLGDELQGAGIAIERVRESSGRFLNTYRAAAEILRQWQREESIDLLHSHKSKENLLALLLARKLGIPHLLRTQHGMPEPHTLKDRLVYAAERASASRVGAVVCVSEELRGRMRRRVPGARLELVSNGIELEKVRSQLMPSEARERLGIAADAPVVGIVGRLDAVKRIDLFLDSARELLRKLPEARFVVSGTGRQQLALEQAAREMNIADEVKFLGERGDVFDVLRSLDLLAITSDHEGLPTVLLEAMALGVAVVARNVGGIGEVVHDGECGRLLEVGDARQTSEAWLELLRDGERRRRLAAEAMRRVRRFSAEHNAAGYLNIYRKLLGL